ncbi:MAG: PIN domain-containing protein [Chitinophagaceae bacterium]|jgi:hypothetical protein|nr:PIN domain-containing protein [Chitinophagaceae bacterium]MCA6438895.1 DUF4935 domain-containing protein [Chitinophagaceae bacterium]MCA6447374.1 DUF4935 domain-containing protein [Chitinophagaceae bacterium]
MEIIIDTNILFDDKQLKGQKLHRLTNKVKENHDTVYLPLVVIKETKNKFREELEASQKKLTANITHIKRNTGVDLPNPLNDSLIEKMISDFNKSFDHQMKSLGIKKIQLTKDGHDELLEKAVLKKKPFSENGTGYRDALIWIAVRELAEKYAGHPSISNHKIVLITANWRDFCASDKFDLHPDLIEELKGYDIDPLTVKIVKDLDVIEDYLMKQDKATYDDVQKLMDNLEFIKTDLGRAVAKLMMDYLPFQGFSPEEIGFPDIYESPAIDSFYEDWEFTLKGVERISQDSIGIKINIAVTCLFDVFIYKSDYYSMDESRSPSIYDYDWNDHYVAGQEEKKVWFTMDIIVNEILSEILSHNIEINDTLNRPPEIPNKRYHYTELR